MVAESDVVVIGAGIYGCAAAYFLSRFGVNVIAVDAGDIGAGASGANAGNLHLQLSPFSHARKSPEWIAEFARTLPFFVEALELWKRLDGELDADIELRRTGGIMVAETDHQLRILHEKVVLERAHGLAVEMIDGAELRQLAPYIAGGVLGASICPGEGMANALLAVSGLADGARKAGARFMVNARVEGMESHSGGWRVDTTRGTIRGRCAVIAAGSSSGEVAAMAGVQLPLTHRDIQMVATEPCEPLIEQLLYHAESRLTLKQVANGNVLIGGGWEASRDPVFGRPAVLICGGDGKGQDFRPLKSAVDADCRAVLLIGRDAPALGFRPSARAWAAGRQCDRRGPQGDFAAPAGQGRRHFSRPDHDRAGAGAVLVFGAVGLRQRRLEIGMGAAKIGYG